MGSQLTGNFDICAEVTEAFLTGFAGVQFDGTTQTSSLNAPISVGGVSVTVTGTVTLRITTTTLTIDPSAAMSAVATLRCDDCALSLVGLTGAQTMPLSGTITIRGIPFQFVEAANKSKKSLQLDFGAASVQAAIALDSANLGMIEAALAQAFDQKSLPASLLGEIPGDLNQALTKALKGKIGTVQVPNASFALVPQGQPGQIGPPTRFCDVEVATRPASSAQPGVLAILGTLFANHSGNVADKTLTATDKSHQGSVTISPDGFQSEFAQKTAEVSLPSGTTISGVTTSMETGKILLNLAGTKSGTGYNSTWNIGGFMTASIPGGVLTLTPTVTSQSVDPQIDWWVWALLGPAAFPLEIAASQIAPGELLAMIPTVEQDIRNATTTINGVIPGFTFDAVAVQSQGIVMQGTAQIPSGVSTEIEGMVTDPDHKPVAGATIAFTPLGAVQATSDANGMYHFDAFAFDAAFAPNSSQPGFSFPPGPFPITASKDGFLTNPQTVKVAAGQPVVRDFVLQPVLPFTLTGKVLSSAGGAAIPNATVTLSTGVPAQGQAAPPAQTKADGGYTIANVNPGQWTGQYTVGASAPGFVTSQNYIASIPNGQAATSNFSLTPLHPFQINVSVTGTFGPETDPNEAPVGGATVTASAPGQSYTAHDNGNGSYTIANVTPGSYNGDYTVVVEAKGFISQKVDVPQPDGASTGVEVDLQRPPSKVPPTPPSKPGTMM